MFCAFKNQSLKMRQLKKKQHILVLFESECRYYGNGFIINKLLLSRLIKMFRLDIINHKHLITNLKSYGGKLKRLITSL